ncbi:DUF4268 domain-containing protein [Pedobacter aquae]|uniref:DUF4268 domain-containing protein n=1 Tax=Pedobacter aquae TaxID=2605747 RepID=A0A5C0VIM4_9SPHI|nr:DUF4268 domain-containing protein [Pedobacter aquae]QEK51613.1 DUF4268 domain-containing protein [Pedobacter aquae]
MYTREEASRIKEEFWTSFGKYLAPHQSVFGTKVNWVNYKTGVKDIYFRMQADKRTASICIAITHADLGLQEIFFEQFQEFKLILEQACQEEWDWQLHTQDDYGRTISRIGLEIHEVNVFNKQDWPAIISFFKPRLIALDDFWYDVKDNFVELSR